MIDLLKSQVLTEKTNRGFLQNKYSFDVDTTLDKLRAKNLFSCLFSVKVKKVNSFVLPRRVVRIGRFKGRKPIQKRIILTFENNVDIPFFSPM